MNKNRSVVLIAGFARSRRLPLIAALQRHGYGAVTAQDGFEALQVAIDRKVDLLLTEDELPGLTGRELIGVVRKHHAIEHCVLVSDSIGAAPGYTELTDGRTGFTVAPFEVEQLLIKIREVLPALNEEKEKVSHA